VKRQTMSLKNLVSRIGKFYWVLLIPAGALTFVYSWMGIIATGFGSSRDGAMAILLKIQPFLAFPLFLVVFYSIRVAVRLLWVYVAGTLLMYVAISWPRVGLAAFLVAGRSLVIRCGGLGTDREYA